MNKEAANKYIKDTSNHISSINQALKVIKSSIIADFICVDDRGIIISTMLWNTLDTDNFYFILFYFSDFISILFFFSS